MSENETPTPEAPETIEVQTAFLVAQTTNGGWQVYGDINTPITLAREVTRNDVRIGCSEMSRALDQQDLAEVVFNTLQQVAAAAAQEPTES